MIDIKFILENQSLVEQAYKNRNQKVSLQEILALNDKRKALQKEFDDLRAEQNRTSKEIAELKKAGQDASELLSSMQKVAERVKDIGSESQQTEDDLKNILMTLPNIPHSSVPVGSDSEGNAIVKTWGEIPTFSFKAREHWEIGENLKMLDFERASKLAGARFCLYRAKLAKLERALAHFMLSEHEMRGYEEIIPPYLVNRATLTGTGQLPKFEEDLFKTNMDSYLIPTAEVPVTNIYAGEVLTEAELPKKFCSFTPCFRSEAGSYGRDVKGLIRQHQFHKVELVKLAHPEQSFGDLETMVADAENILEKLRLPYRRMLLCTGDMGFGSVKTYDLEVWLPGQNAYREISSCSNCGDFQARRMNTRFKNGEGKLEFVHTLNGSGLAVGRTLIAVLENYQNADGSVTVPEVLRPFMGCERIERI